MNGFLRQLASRSLGTAPRLRSAPSPQAAALQGIVPANRWRAGARGEIGEHVAMAASASAVDVDATPGRTRPGQPSLRDLAPAARGPATLDAQSAGAHEPDAAPALARTQPTHIGAAAMSAEEDAAARDAPQGAQHLLAPQRRPLSRHAVEPDHDMADAQPADTAAASPPTRPLFTAATRSPLGRPDAAAIGGSSALPDRAHANALAARNASRDLGDAASAPRLPAQPPSLPEVHITIDRLEVAPPPMPRAGAAQRSSALSLRDYLAARRSGLP